MKKPLYFVPVLIALAILTTITVSAAVPGQNEASDLVLKGISLDPPDPFPDQPEVKVILTFENQGKEPVQMAEYRLEIWTTDDEPKRVSTSEKTSEFEGGLAPESSREVVTTITAPPQEGDYEVRIYLPREAEEPAIKTSFKIESALPPQVGRLFAALGIFIAVMAIMAAGTEVIVDTIKFAVGMKRKVTALEAYDKLKSELPGQLVALGVDAQSQKLFKDTCEGIDGTLDTVGQLQKATAEMKQGHFGAAFTELESIAAFQTGVQGAQQQLDGLKRRAILAVPRGFSELQRRLHLDPQLVNNVQAVVVDRINQVHIQPGQQGQPAQGIGLVDILDDVVLTIQRLVKDAEQTWTAAWLKERADDVLEGAISQVEASITEVTQTLQELGFQGASIERTKLKLANALGQAEGAVRAKVDAYLKGAQELLKGVSELRTDVHQWFRDHGLAVGLVVLVITILAAVLFAVSGALTPINSLWVACAGIIIGSLLIVFGQTPTEGVGPIEPTSLAKVLVKQEHDHQREEARRVGVLKLISFVVGVFLAYQLNIDAFDFLRGSIMSSAAISRINLPIVPAPSHPLTVGILLTGMAATAGSAFWHDQLDRLQSAKRQAESIAKVVQQVREQVSTTTEE